MSTAPKTAAPASGRAATKKELPEHFKAYKHVWVFIEQERGQVHPVSWELMGAGRKLADRELVGQHRVFHRAEQGSDDAEQRQRD